jgi:hypothetical protein
MNYLKAKQYEIPHGEESVVVLFNTETNTVNCYGFRHKLEHPNLTLTDVRKVREAMQAIEGIMIAEGCEETKHEEDSKP